MKYIQVQSAANAQRILFLFFVIGILFLLIIVILDIIILISIVAVVKFPVKELLLLVVRKVLESHISVLKLYRVRPLGLDKARIYDITTFRHLTFVSYNHTFRIGCIIEEHKGQLSSLNRLLQSHGINRPCTEIEHTVPCRYCSSRIKSLEKYNLILRKTHIHFHTFGESVERRITFNLINPCKSFYSGKGYPILHYHSQKVFSLSRHKGTKYCVSVAIFYKKHYFWNGITEIENPKTAIRVENTPVKDTFLSISGPAQGLFKDNGSRFIALAYPVETEEQVRTIVEGLKKEYHDARHHCYAYRLGYLGDRFRANDDGEPSSSAGRPILGQIDANSLSDILVVVVRYFGGIKLGIPGLIRAYRTSTADAIANASIVEKTASRRFRVSFGYMNMNDVMKTVKDLDLVQERQDFGMSCSFETPVRLSLVQTFTERTGKIEGCSIEEI